MTIDKQIEEVLPYFQDTDEYLSDNFGDVVLHKNLIAACLQAVLEGACRGPHQSNWAFPYQIKDRIKEIIDEQL